MLDFLSWRRVVTIYFVGLNFLFLISNVCSITPVISLPNPINKFQYRFKERVHSTVNNELCKDVAHVFRSFFHPFEWILLNIYQYIIFPIKWNKIKMCSIHNALKIHVSTCVYYIKCRVWFYHEYLIKIWKWNVSIEMSFPIYLTFVVDRNG